MAFLIQLLSHLPFWSLNFVFSPCSPHFPTLEYTHIYSHTYLHTLTVSVSVSMPTILTPTWNVPYMLPARYCSSCKHWRFFLGCINLSPSPSPLKAYQAHSSGVPWLIAWFQFLHSSVFSPGPLRPLTSEALCDLVPVCPNDCVASTLLHLFCSVYFSHVGLLCCLPVLRACSCPIAMHSLPSALRSWHD